MFWLVVFQQSTDKQVILGARCSHVEEAAPLGQLTLLLPPGRQLPGDSRLMLPLLHVEYLAGQAALFVTHEDGVIRGLAPASGIRQHDQRELKPLGLMHSHQGKRAIGLKRRLAFAQLTHAELAEHRLEVREVQRSAFGSYLNQLLHVAAAPMTIRQSGQRRQIAGAFQRRAQQFVDAEAPGQLRQFAQTITGSARPWHFVLWQPTRLLQRVPQRRTRVVFVAHQSQCQQRIVAECEERRAQDAGQRELVVMVVQKAQQIEQVKHFLAAVEAASAHGHIGKRQFLERFLKEGHAAICLKQQRHIAVAERASRADLPVIDRGLLLHQRSQPQAERLCHQTVTIISIQVGILAIQQHQLQRGMRAGHCLALSFQRFSEFNFVLRRRPAAGTQKHLAEDGIQQVQQRLMRAEGV